MLIRDELKLSASLPGKLLNTDTYFVTAKAIIVVMIALIYLLRVDHVFGQFVDDAWYIVLARSLAEQGNYQLISSPITGIQPSYPPGFPFLLAIILKVAPLEPGQFWIFKIVSILGMLGGSIGVYKYCRNIKGYSEQISWLAMLAVVLMPAFVFLATSMVMAECIFVCFQLWTVYQIEIAAQDKIIKFQKLFLIGSLAAASSYVRSAGLVLLIAAVLRVWSCFGWRRAMFLAIIIGAMISPWMAYCQLAFPNKSLKEKHGGNIVYSYFEALKMKAAGVSGSGQATTSDYILRVQTNIKSILSRDMIGMFLPAALRDAGGSGEEVLGLGGDLENSMEIDQFATAAQIVSLLFSVIIILGFVTQALKKISVVELLVPGTLALIIIWPWLSFRFVLPLAPFLVSYFIDGLSVVSRWFARLLRANWEPFAIARVTFICFIFFFVAEHFTYLKLKLANPKNITWIDVSDKQDEIYSWVKENLPVGSMIASSNPAKVFLLTGHQSVSSDLSPDSLKFWRESNIRYIETVKPGADERLKQQGINHKVLFQKDGNKGGSVIEILPPQLPAIQNAKLPLTQ